MPFEFQPGRYYAAMWYLDIPRAITPHGGNFTALLWRFESEPSTWHLTYRHRYYTNLNEPVNVAQSKDRFSWYELKMTGSDETKALEGIGRFFRILKGIVGLKPPDVFWIRGNVEEFFKLVNSDKKPHWLHRVATTEAQK